LEAIVLSEPNRIMQLDDATIGHIAAGEVVERPAQVVKELLENSLDAGSKRIVITVERGGFDLIRIEDDGSGIDAADLPLALDRHATSKLKKREDLNSIHTLGFRGEALASIGMVSGLSIASRPTGTEGKRILMEDGIKGKTEPFGMAEGSRIDVEHLFQNTPARLAFQRRPATENARIVDVVVAHAMAHMSVAFRLLIDERVVLDVPASEAMTDRLYDLLGGQAQSMLALSAPAGDAQAPGDEQWSGWISTPDITRGKGDDIHILINDRPVASGPFLQAIRRGYRTRLMQGRHPLAVLSLTLPPSEVDVNVHPTKREVRLRHSWRVLERLERAIAHTLESVPTEPDAAGGIPGLQGLNQQQANSIQEHFKRQPNPSETEPVDSLSAAAGTATVLLPKASNSPPGPPAWAIAAGAQLNLHGGEAEPTEKPVKQRPLSTAPSAQDTLPGMDNAPTAPALSPAERELHRHAGQGKRSSPSDESPLGEIINDLPKMEPLAQFADSYILVQAEDELLLIDQHALHERVRYERLRNDESIWASQTRLQPLELDLDARQSARMEAAQDRFRSIGFELQHKEQGWSVTASPQLLQGKEVVPFILDLLQDTSEDGAPLTTVDDRKDHLAFLNACRGAVKANEKLTLPEMRRLLDDMRRIPNPWACVHGRPTALRLPLDALDHHFGRHG
jgi:DNA mismatch repair protein MutL